MTAHPTEFYIAHGLFNMLPGQPWGTLTDGPANYDEAVNAAAEHFIGNMRLPSLETLRAWHFQDDVRARDVTDEFMEAVYERLVEAGHLSMEAAE